jgi:hypothetical protein
MNSIVKTAAKITEDLNGAKQDEIQQTKAKLGEVLKNWKNKGNAWAIHTE